VLGVPSLDILGNIVPFISGEEEKLEIEVGKILAPMNSEMTGFSESPVKVSASCNRVPVVDGHTESVFVEFQNTPPTIEQIQDALKEYKCEPQILGVPSAPKQAIVLTTRPDRPQPRLDAEYGNGNGVLVGRVRPCQIFHVKFTLLAHNTILGAAGSSIMNAEVAVSKGFIK
jgi:aspartate-semialdehyde dehydrogenase